MPVNDLLKAKINHGFGHLDVDGDGLLTEQDHVLMGRRAAEALGHAPDSPQEQRIVDAYLRVWHELHLPHIPGGGTAISREQFVASTVSLADDRGPRSQRRRDRRGVPGHRRHRLRRPGEPHRVPGVPARALPGLTESEVAEAFDHLDTDGDGYLTAEEFTRACVEFWSSTDPDAPGNWWMGRPAR